MLASKKPSTTPAKRGGRRPGAGRPPRAGGAGRRLSVYLSPAAVAALESTGDSLYSAASQVVERWAVKTNRNKSQNND